MKTIFYLSWKSLWNRKLSTGLCILSIAMSVFLLLGIERIRSSAKSSFESTVSGVNLIVGARGGGLNLMLYTVFRIGNPTNNISYSVVKKIQDRKDVSWAVPISLGDSHRSYRVAGTNNDFFKYFKFAEGKPLEFAKGHEFSGLFDVVIGSDVARDLKYDLGRSVVLAHGVEDTGLQEHDNLPFEVVGILKKTGTPVDRSLHISLEAMEAIHYDWQSGVAPSADKAVKADFFKDKKLVPGSITGIFVGLKDLLSVFKAQREINEDKTEPLTAIIPSLTLTELWQIMDGAEKAFLATSILVLFSSLVAIFLAIQSSLQERRREMAILRSLGAQPRFLFSLFLVDSLILSVIGVIAGLASLFGLLLLLHTYLENEWGLGVGLFQLGTMDFVFLSLTICGAIVASIYPAYMAYKNTLQDGLSIKV